MRAFRWPLVIAAAGFINVFAGCGAESPPDAAVAADGAGSAAHGDHSPHHGGVVMMKGDLHYEIVLDAAGRYRLYFSDAAREDLPAAAASSAAVTVMRPGEAPERVDLRIDESGESWVGQGRPIADVSATTARIAYTLRGEEQYWIDLPFGVDASPAGPHR